MGPFGTVISAKYGAVGDTAVIELANASGFNLQGRSQLNPFVATSWGTGQLISDAIDRKFRKILLGIGGSATVDGGIGAMAALGAKFYDSFNNEIKPFGNDACHKVKRVDATEFVSRCKDSAISFACDVDSPLLGPRGAACLFGPQKMSDAMRQSSKLAELVAKLEMGLKNLSGRMVECGGRDVQDIKGVGAAGGFPLGFCSFLDSKLENGAELIFRAINFEQYCKCDIAVTCEGFCDSQTLRGKSPYAVCKWMKGKHVIVICGGLENEDVEKGMLDAGASMVLPLVDRSMALDSSIARIKELLRRATFRGVYSYLMSREAHQTGN
jgi:glycerate kinase